MRTDLSGIPGQPVPDPHHPVCTISLHAQVSTTHRYQVLRVRYPLLFSPQLRISFSGSKPTELQD